MFPDSGRMLKRAVLMFGPWDSEKEIPFFTGVSEMMCHVAVLLPFPEILTTCEDDFRVPQNSRWKE